MKKIILYIFLCFVVGGTLSCKKGFLEIADKTVLVKEAYVNNLETTGHFLNGVYFNIATNYANYQGLPTPELAGDNMKTNPGGGSRYNNIANWMQIVNNENSIGKNSNGIWQYLYGAIRDCNYVYEKAEEFKNDNPSKASDLKGQSLALRAYMHFILVNTFAQSYNYTTDASHIGIPYITSSDTRLTITRQSVAQVYQRMITDLSNSLELLPVGIKTPELMNSEAVKALLARIYLFMGDYSSAKKFSRSVLQNVPLITTTYPDALYTPNETEALFQFSVGSDVSAQPYYKIGFFASPSFQFYSATNDIAQLLTADFNDKRSRWVTFNAGKWLITKFPTNVTTPVVPGQPDYNDYYQTLLRSSEMALTAAESYAKLSLIDSARYFLDEIRLRANPTLKPTTLSGNDLIEAIYNERRKEMAFDGIRMFDLLRWKRGVNRLDANMPAGQQLPYPSDKAIAPIPLQDVQLLGLEQNKGYQ